MGCEQTNNLVGVSAETDVLEKLALIVQGCSEFSPEHKTVAYHSGEKIIIEVAVAMQLPDASAIDAARAVDALRLKLHSIKEVDRVHITLVEKANSDTVSF